MDLLDIVIYGLKNLKSRKLRSWLTILGMVIGVMAITVILSVSEGFNKDINDQVAAFGADQMFIYPAADIASTFSGGGGSLAPTSGKLYQEDVDDIKNIPGVKTVARTIFGRVSISYKGNNITSTIFAADPEMFDINENYIEIESGRFYKETEKNVAFFGADAASETFGNDEVQVGSVIQINEKNYRAVGIQKRIGTSLSSQDDASIYIPFESGKDLFKGQILNNEVGLIMVQVDEGFDPEKIKSTIERKLADNHRVKLDDLDFSVVTSAQISEIIGTVLFSIQIVLSAVTLIASLVGALGIANTMFMNVLERVKEIGILKSVGASQKDILLIFVIESAIIGLAGGFIGLMLGYLILYGLDNYFDIPVLLRFRIIIFVFIFSIGTGVLAGIIPSYRAAKMNPVDALRQ